MKVYIADCNHGFFTPEYEEAAKADIVLITDPCTQDTLIEKCQGSHIIIVQRLEITGEIVDQIPSCRVVTRYGVGLDNIDCKAMEDRGIAVINFPGFCTEEVANHTLMALLFLYRRYPIIQNNPRLLQEWGNPNLIQPIHSASKTHVGIVGLGRIGGAVAKRLLSCGFSVIGYDPYISNDRWQQLGIEQCSSIENLFSDADIVSLHVPLTPETHQFVGERLLDRMTTGASLINTSRGEVVVTADLIKALSTTLNSAFIDVCDPEPPPQELLQTPRLHVSHHCAFYSVGSLEYLKRQVIIDSVKAYEMQSNTSSGTI